VLGVLRRHRLRAHLAAVVEGLIVWWLAIRTAFARRPLLRAAAAVSIASVALVVPTQLLQRGSPARPPAPVLEAARRTGPPRPSHTASGPPPAGQHVARPLPARTERHSKPVRAPRPVRPDDVALRPFGGSGVGVRRDPPPEPHAIACVDNVVVTAHLCLDWPAASATSAHAA
jgi:hypothetical protein